MRRPRLLAPTVLLLLAGCSTETSVTVPSADTLKSSPAGVAVFGFLDIMTTVPGILGGSYASCVTATPGTGGAVALALAGCSSAGGGTLAGTLNLASTPVTGGTNFVETFAPLTATRATTLHWVYAGAMDLAVRGTSGAVTAQPGFNLTVTDTQTPANDKVWTFTFSLTAATATSGGYTLQGSYGLTSNAQDAVSVQIDAPLTWNAGSTYPVSGQVTITDARGGANASSITAVFAPGQVTINGGVVTY